MNNSILRVKHGATEAVTTLITRLIIRGSIDYHISAFEHDVINVVDGRDYKRNITVKEYDLHEAALAIADYVEEQKESTTIVARNQVGKAEAALDFINNIA